VFYPVVAFRLDLFPKFCLLILLVLLERDAISGISVAIEGVMIDSIGLVVKAVLDLSQGLGADINTLEL